MKDRLVTALGLLGVLALVYGLFFQRPSDRVVTRPISTEAGRNGYLGLRTWLEREGVRVVSLQERFDRLRDPELGLPAGGNVLVITLPHKNPLRFREPAELRTWITQGNTALVLAALDDTPDWTVVADVTGFLRDLSAISGLSFASATPTAAGRTRAPVPGQSALRIAPLEAHPLMRGVKSLVGFSDLSSELWSARDPTGRVFYTRLGVEERSGLDAMWQIPFGRGQVLVAASGTLLTNENIARTDARRFVANLLAYHLGSGGAVIFDDMHQGLSRLYDAAALARDPRTRATLVFIFAAWLVWVLGSTNRLRVPEPPADHPRQADFVGAAAGFMARRLDPREAGLLLCDQWFDEVRRARGLPRRDEPPWEELAATPALDRRSFEELREAHERLSAGRSVGLVRLHNILQHAREAIG
ncbi:MAG TPA: DUF4350 domain-containing protein [Gammaproteobacteria bacterium]|nr:DUF4350 domain-containing protein [Gammaproteobacteria bacterium]